MAAKIKNIFSLINFLVIVGSPLIVVAAGLVPCGSENPCQLCDIFVLFDNVVKFVLTHLVPPAAVIMLVIGGIMFFTAMGDPNKVNQAKDIIQWTIIGLFIIYGAWVIVNTFFLLIGVAKWTGLKGGWFEYPCPYK